MNYLMTRNTANDFDTFFNDMLGNWGIKNSTIPSVDVYEDEKAYYLEAELPGYTQDDVNVHVEKQTHNEARRGRTCKFKSGERFIKEN